MSRPSRAREAATVHFSIRSLEGAFPITLSTKDRTFSSERVLVWQGSTGGTMRADIRAPLLATAILTSIAGIALAEGAANKSAGAGQAGGRGDVGTSSGSMGAGGMTGTGATKDGARTGTGVGGSTTGSDGASGASHGSSPAAPAPGTTR
ncbi:hypothetical protein MOX02_51310 [Methylobacterium oxalidis]|uniref:Uncharacterized protein n=1 Tax=Methylobacterium oxalidis TaxID=944322 RepID=A0A512JAW7_9HYPH|nr:hypothetical protein MOX02_51310 [Methylobacterium oxalidis]GLS66160.1 hypothetical protein GCM10007888_45420 [Methylobacterium oxalidis]